MITHLVDYNSYSVGSLDWQFSNVTADTTYQFVTSDTLEGIDAGDTNVFELRGACGSKSSCMLS